MRNHYARNAKLLRLDTHPPSLHHSPSFYVILLLPSPSCPISLPISPLLTLLSLLIPEWFSASRMLLLGASSPHLSAGCFLVYYQRSNTLLPNATQSPTWHGLPNSRNQTALMRFEPAITRVAMLNVECSPSGLKEA